MSELRDELRYASTHEWVLVEADGTVVVGISDYAQDALGDVVYAELPEVGATYEVGAEVAALGSVKAASGIYAPVGGEVVAGNDALEYQPELINDSPYDAGWWFKLKPSSEWESDMQAKLTA